MREISYNNAELRPIVEALDNLFLAGKSKDLATLIGYAAHRIEDMDSRLAEQIADGIAKDALAITRIGGGV